MPAGKPYFVYTLHGDVFAARHDVVAPCSGIELALPELGKLRLELVDATSREAIETNNLYRGAFAWRARGESGYQLARPMEVAPGQVELELPIGELDLVVCLAARGYVPTPVLHVDVIQDGEPATVVELTRGVDLKLRLSGDEPFGDEHRKHAYFVLDASHRAALAAR
ncbi:MAG: hypothetical protein GY711_00160 [bacterium]|nr:hypothetical protein [bacterium]